MTKSESAPSTFFRFLSVSLVCLLICTASRAEDSLFLGSKNPYTPQQDPGSYELPPRGFSLVFTQLVARHGSRGLSSPSNDLAVYNMWQQAQAYGGLTKVGARLGDDLLRIIRANALLGYGVNGITAPGYGNLTQTGIMEHTQLAQRLASRTAPLLSNVVEHASTNPRQLIVSTSGVNRAVDSANFFVKSLGNAVPGISPLIVNSAPLSAYPATKRAMQAAGVNRFLLYFHKLAAKTDLPAPSDPYYPVYQSSLAYQKYLASDPTMLDKINSILYSSASRTMARAVLETTFTKAFVDAIDNGKTTYANTDKFTFISDDGKFTTSVVGDGGTTISNIVDAANSLYAVYSIIPAMIHEAPVNLGKYFPTGQLAILSYLSDVEDFYQKGPGIAEAAPVTYKMSQALLDDFFSESEAIATGHLAHAAKLRFTHAEIIMPFAERLGLPNATVAVPAADDYTYDNNPWRGADIAPLAANVQWDLYTNGRIVLVKMYYNEKEIDFPAACEAARYFVHTHYYKYSGLKTCYGYK